MIGHWPHWHSSVIVLAAVSGRSAAGPVRPLPDILVKAGAYRVGHSGCIELLQILLDFVQS